MELKEKQVMVYGAAKSGLSAAGLLQKLGSVVLIFDKNKELTKQMLKERYPFSTDFTLITGELTQDKIKALDLLIISPGVATDHPDILKVMELGIPVWSEVELAYKCTKGKIIGITGTNGKTTTTTLVGEIMKAYYEEVFVVGNIGNCYSEAALSTTEQSVTVIELSSFQLETIHDLKLDVSAILNITPDHLDRHYTMDNYIAMKERITRNQSNQEICILNYEDEILRQMAKRIRAKVIYFSSKRELSEGLYLKDENIICSRNGVSEIFCNVNELHILGNHNYENVMAAVLMALNMDVPMDVIRKAVLSFKGVEHRIEYVETINGVTYYNDSKGTNPDASIRAVQAMRCSTVLIGGGYDKKIPFDELIESFEGKIKALVLLGQTREEFAETAKKHGFENVILVDTLKEAVLKSASITKPGEAVLLSPACASWGMFENYEQRGRLFKEYVRELR